MAATANAIWAEPWKDFTPAREAQALAPAGIAAHTASDRPRPRVSLRAQVRPRDSMIGVPSNPPAARTDRIGAIPP